MIANEVGRERGRTALRGRRESRCRITRPYSFSLGDITIRWASGSYPVFFFFFFFLLFFWWRLGFASVILSLIWQFSWLGTKQ
jgi:hypothetical protein